MEICVYHNINTLNVEFYLGNWRVDQLALVPVAPRVVGYWSLKDAARVSCIVQTPVIYQILKNGTLGI